MRRLTPLVRSWPGEGRHARSTAGVEVLAAIGTDVALTHLYGGHLVDLAVAKR